MEGKKEKFLVQVLNEVKFGYDQPEIKAELEEHIYERSQWFLEKGMRAEDAEDEAVRRMGDPKKLGKQLNKNHNQWVGFMDIHQYYNVFYRGCGCCVWIAVYWTDSGTAIRRSER